MESVEQTQMTSELPTSYFPQPPNALMPNLFQQFYPTGTFPEGYMSGFPNVYKQSMASQNSMPFTGTPYPGQYFYPYGNPLHMLNYYNSLGTPMKPLASEGVTGNKRKLREQAVTIKKVKNGRRVCIVDDCTKFAQGGTHKCISHGGGKRCCHPGCTKSAYGTTRFCISHGGGKRCTYPNCTKSSQGSTNKCKAHGGGRRCKKEGCKKSAQGSSFCKAHGGGKRCIVAGCTKLARGKPYFSCCVTHGRQLMLTNQALQS